MHALANAINSTGVTWETVALYVRECPDSISLSEVSRSLIFPSKICLFDSIQKAFMRNMIGAYLSSWIVFLVS